MKEIVHKQLIVQLNRLNIVGTPILDFYNKYILKEVDDSELLKEIRRSKKDPPILELPNVLENELILLQTIKIVTLMEISEDIEEFDKLSKKIKTNKNTKQGLTDFDKILKGFLAVEKPTAEELKKQQDKPPTSH